MSAAVGTWSAASVILIGGAAMILLIVLVARRRGARALLGPAGPAMVSLGCLLYLMTTSVSLSLALVCLVWGLLDRDPHGQDGQRVEASST